MIFIGFHDVAVSQDSSDDAVWILKEEKVVHPGVQHLVSGKGSDGRFS
jgi:hypothetical protein